MLDISVLMPLVTHWGKQSNALESTDCVKNKIIIMRHAFEERFCQALSKDGTALARMTILYINVYTQYISLCMNLIYITLHSLNLHPKKDSLCKPLSCPQKNF